MDLAAFKPGSRGRFFGAAISAVVAIAAVALPRIGRAQKADFEKMAG